MSALNRELNRLANYACLLSPWGHGPLPTARVQLVAHRGAYTLPGVIENTRAAFDPCLAAGVWGIELDIRFSRDGEPVVHHDPSCGRTFGRPDIAIASTDYQDLKQLIPDLLHLTEVVERYGGRMHLMLEIKENPGQRSGCSRTLRHLLESLVPEQDYHLLSLVPEDLEAFRDLPDAALVDVAWRNVGDIIDSNQKLCHGAVGGSFALLGNARLRRLRENGRKVGTGFVNTRAALCRELNRGVDWIFSDKALVLQSMLDREAARS